ncbi:hypothetical protein [Micromonospora avicenniae]
MPVAEDDERLLVDPAAEGPRRLSMAVHVRCGGDDALERTLPPASDAGE